MSEAAAGESLPAASTAELRARAAAVLRADDAGTYTVPSKLTYPHQWNWDSALAALGWAELDPPRAFLELETLMGGQYRDGLVPHIAFRPALSAPIGTPARLQLPNGRGYLPGPAWWGRRSGADGRRISGITQPPLAATCLRLLFERTPVEPRARALLGPIARWHDFLLTDRDPAGRGEPVLIHPWESGRDNALEWDRPLSGVTPRLRMLRRRDTRSVDAIERPNDWEYVRFLSIVRNGTNVAWPQHDLAEGGEFRVLDPGFSAILARACADLAWLAEQLSETALAERSSEQSALVSDALRARADSTGMVWPVDLSDDEELQVVGAGSVLAALTPGLDGRMRDAIDRLVSEGGALCSRVGVRSLDRGSPDLQPRCYWRGPTWTNITWLCALGLRAAGDEPAALDLGKRLRSAVEEGGMREYFEPETGDGLGAQDFAWTAALVLWELDPRS